MAARCVLGSFFSFFLAHSIGLLYDWNACQSSLPDAAIAARPSRTSTYIKVWKRDNSFFFLLPGKNSNQTLREKKKTYNINKKTRGKTIYKETQEILSSLSRLFQKLLKAVTHKNKRDWRLFGWENNKRQTCRTAEVRKMTEYKNDSTKKKINNK